MRLATLRTQSGTVAVRVDDDHVIEIQGAKDVGHLLADADWQSRANRADGASIPLSDLKTTDWAPVVSEPSKIICIGLNYRNHILEMGRDIPEYPTLFAKYPEALIGPYDDIVVPKHAAAAVDWEGELAVVIGKRARRLTSEQARAAIAGYSVINDITMRDFQNRTPEWLQCKTFEATTPIGPVLVTQDDFQLGTELRTDVDGQVVQRSKTDDLVFDPAALVAYISQIVPLNAGDVIATGTPGGVGHARKPPQYLHSGHTLTTTIEGIGSLVNAIRMED